MMFEKIQCSVFEYFNNKVWLLGPSKSMVMVISIFNHCLIVKMVILEIKIFIEFNCFLIIIHIILQFQLFIDSR